MGRLWGNHQVGSQLINDCMLLANSTIIEGQKNIFWADTYYEKVLYAVFHPYLAHLSWKLKLAILINCHPCVFPSGCQSVHLTCKFFTFSSSPPEFLALANGWMGFKFVQMKSFSNGHNCKMRKFIDDIRESSLPELLDLFKSNLTQFNLGEIEGDSNLFKWKAMPFFQWGR